MGHVQAELSALSLASQLARQRLMHFEDPNHEPGLPQVSVERHRDVIASEISQAEMLVALLEPGITALDAQPEKEKEAQTRRSGWAFDMLLPYLMRDWTGTAELQAAKSLIDAVLRKIFPDSSGRSIAVAGCGAGGLLTGIPATFEHIVGFDLTLPILAAARHLLDGKSLDVSLPRAIHETGRISLRSDDSNQFGTNVAVVAMDAFDTAFADGALDCVITSFIIDFIPEPNKLAAEIYRILSSDGVWINYGPSGPLKAHLRFDNAETVAFFETVGFMPIHSEAHRTTYLDLSRDCPSWSTRSHMCYLTAGRKTKRRQEISKAPARNPAQLAKVIPHHYPEAHIIRRENLGENQSRSIALRFARIPGKMERAGIDPEDVRVLELVDGKRTVEEIANLLDRKVPPRPADDTFRAFTRYFERNLLSWRPYAD
jgi:SAM-dependent methyltransferase